jgi:hypothetical protein
VISVAHEQLRELVRVHGVGRLESRLGVAEGTVRGWLDGRAPQKRMRARAAEVLGIPADAWTVPAGAVPKPPPPRAGTGAAPAAPAVPAAKAPAPAPGEPLAEADLDPRANAVATLRALRRHLEEAERDEVAALANAITSSSRLLARLTGQLEISESQIVRSVPWRKAKALLEEALAPYPEAARAVAAAFEEFGR